MPSSGGPQTPGKVQTTQPTYRNISGDDLLDKIGAGAMADVAVMTLLAAIVGTVLGGALLMIIRKAFVSRADMEASWRAGEKIWMGLLVRREKATAEVSQLSKQITALERDLSAQNPTRGV